MAISKSFDTELDEVLELLAKTPVDVILDVTVSGLGRGAGNCALELLLGFLKNPKYNQMPVLEFIEKHIVQLEKELDWGYSIPYMITGQLNEHPRTAIKAREEKDTKYIEFFKNLSHME